MFLNCIDKRNNELLLFDLKKGILKLCYLNCSKSNFCQRFLGYLREMKTKLFLLLLVMGILVLQGCARTLMPTSYLDHPEATRRAGMNRVWVAEGVRLALYQNILVKGFSIENTRPLNSKIDFSAKAALFQEMLIADLRAKGKNATSDIIELRQNEPYLILEGNMVQINPGSRALRYWVCFGAGRSLVEIESKVDTVQNEKNKNVAEFSVGKSKFIGSWGGDSNKFIDDGLHDIAKLISNFICSN